MRAPRSQRGQRLDGRVLCGDDADSSVCLQRRGRRDPSCLSRPPASAFGTRGNASLTRAQSPRPRSRRRPRRPPRPSSTVHCARRFSFLLTLCRGHLRGTNVFRPLLLWPASLRTGRDGGGFGARAHGPFPGQAQPSLPFRHNGRL
ncbi:hypothetical protein C8Q79DRAFT_952524 [Trametes meyenii]|nr:hypothetical protein C8Q79DRAFT_952524 [Trametes meyenii]